MSEYPIVPNEEFVFDPDQEFEPIERRKRVIDFNKRLMALAKETGKKAAEIGSDAGRAYLNLMETSILNDQQCIKDIKELDDHIMGSGSSRENCQIYLAGWKSELAVAHFFYEEAGYSVYSTTREQDFHKIDFIAIDPNNHSYTIQVKAMSLKDTGENRLRSNVDIINPLDNIDDLNAFFSNISKLIINNKIILSIDKPERKAIFTPPLNDKQVLDLITYRDTLKIQADPDPEFLNTHNQADDRISKIILDALTMYKELRDDDNTPIMMILGSPESDMSDINSRQAKLSNPARTQAISEMNKLSKRFENS